MSGNLFRPLQALAAGVIAIALALGAAAPAAAEPEWDPTLPKLISAGAPGDPVAMAQASLAFTQQAAKTTMDLGRKFLAGLGIGGSPTALPGGRVRGPQAIEYVIARGVRSEGCRTRGVAAPSTARAKAWITMRGRSVTTARVSPATRSPAWVSRFPSTRGTSTTRAGTSRRRRRSGGPDFLGPRR